MIWQCFLCTFMIGTKKSIFRIGGLNFYFFKNRAVKIAFKSMLFWSFNLFLDSQFSHHKCFYFF